MSIRKKMLVMPKKNQIISYQNLTPDLKEIIQKKYPLGWVNHMIKVKTVGDAFFYAITIDTTDISYLVKVPVRIDTKSEKDDEDILSESLDLANIDEKAEDEDKEDKVEEEKSEEWALTKFNNN